MGIATASAQQAPAPATPPAQKPAAKPAPAQKPAAQKPAATAPAAQTPPAQASGQGAAPQIPAVAIPWMKRCGEDPNLKKTVCNMEQTIISDMGQFLVRFGILEVKDDPKKVFTVAFPNGVLLRNGFRVTIANDQPQAGTFVICDERTCRGDVPIDGAFIDRMKKAPGLTLQVANAAGRVVSYPIGLGDFAKTYDGAQTEPGAWEAQVKKIQDDIKERQQAAQAAAQVQNDKAKEGLEKYGADRLKNAAQPAQ
ncbi:invasion associated locus B family protein [Ancylobacter terrae]|uniref:invasion associated locus B family protein n=1 Tax=Ancylobacter sp. sgz301288 TaxID=3342077 RepID=UPI00385B7683